MLREDLNRLQAQSERLKSIPIASLFKADSSRFEHFSRRLGGVFVDFSKQHLDSEALENLIQICEHQNLNALIENLFSGELINHSEQRAALHMHLRAPNPQAEISDSLQKLDAASQVLKAHQTHAEIRDIIALGIGGSELGPALLTQALRAYDQGRFRLHFISNLDGLTLEQTLKKLDPKKTIAIISSKTFSTLETMLNAEVIKNWLNINQIYAVTAKTEKAAAWGILNQNIFEFWDWVGGRYSIWSSIALPAILVLGMDHFKSFLAGAHLVDQHFLNTKDYRQNLPVLMALIDVWNRNGLSYPTHAIIPYNDGLEKLPHYLQQLEMESNGKSVLRTANRFCNQATAPVLWGGLGCNGQHAFAQLLHQSLDVIPIDFIASIQEPHQYPEHQANLLASVLAQARSLMLGTPAELKDTALHQACPGNKPSTMILLDTLSPYNLGSLLALYEHKVFATAMLWDINPFDQWGVELGKKLTTELKPLLNPENPDLPSSLDSSTAGLIQEIWKGWPS
ncbi:MAG: glucose-6-phosphate isomerase [Gammaproteobacteria bacterium]